MTTKEQMKKHIEKWKRSGLSKARYAERAGLGVHKLGYWIQKLDKAVGESGEGQFLPIARTEDKIEIELKNGSVIKLPFHTSEKRLQSILEIISC